MLLLDVRFVQTDLQNGGRPVSVASRALVVRQQINVLRRANPRRLPFSVIDRLVLGSVCGLFPKAN
jgi:hypothetical protein